MNDFDCCYVLSSNRVVLVGRMLLLMDFGISLLTFIFDGLELLNYHGLIEL